MRLTKNRWWTRYSPPRILEILDQPGSAKYFSVFDLASGFHQIGMERADVEKTAFSTPCRHYEYKRMSFGLENATFQRLMDSILTGLQETELFVYLDNIVIYASSLDELRAKFGKLTSARCQSKTTTMGMRVFARGSLLRTRNRQGGYKTVHCCPRISSSKDNEKRTRIFGSWRDII